MRARSRFVAAIAACSAFAACASVLGVDGDYTENDTTGASGPGGVSSTGSSTSSASAGGSTSASSDASASSAGGSGGATVSSTAASSSGAGGMVPLSWNLYSFDMASAVWTSVPISTAWTGMNAPPTTGIIAATHLAHFDKLLVFADNGMYYLADAGVWQVPIPTSARFPEVQSPTKLDTLYHVPSDWNTLPESSWVMPLAEGLTFLENPLVTSYNMNATDVVTFEGEQTIASDPPLPGAPQATGTALWSFEIWNQSQIGSGEGYVVWWGYSNGNVYKFDANNVWTSYPAASAPLWANKPGAPNWSTVGATYFFGNPANGVGTIVFIGP